MKKFSSLLVVLLLMSVSFSAHAQGYPRGDVDRDGSVNISDVTCLIDNLLNGISEGDVDQDGAVNISDATCLIDYLLQGTWPDDPVAPPEEHDWVDLGLPSGTLWATCNIGASNPEEYGDYFAWGETEPKDIYNMDTYMWYIEYQDANGHWHSGYTKYCDDSYYGYNDFFDGKTELELEDDAAYVNWGPSWRMPSRMQIYELLYCTWRWTRRNGVYGKQGTGPNGNTIFLPAAGVMTSEGLYNAGSRGHIWSRTLVPDYCWLAYEVGFDSDRMFLTNDNQDATSRSTGNNVRAVRVP